jgi:hypothetical protein
MKHNNNNFSDENKQVRANLLGYIAPLLIDYVENNGIDLVVCYEVCHELELMVADQCRTKGIKTNELQYHKQVAEKNFKSSKDS